MTRPIPLSLLALFAAAACSPAPSSEPPPQPTAPVETAAPTAAASATAVASAAPTASAAVTAPTAEPVAAPAPTADRAPSFPPLDEFKGPGLPKELAEVAKAMDEKYFSDAITLLTAERKKFKRGGALDAKIVIDTLLARAHLLSGETAAADRRYRKVVAQWGRFNREARKLEKKSKERYERVMDAFGESLFALGETKREKATDIAFPYYDESSNPADMKSFMDNKAKRWITKVKNAVKRADKEYDRVLSLKPPAPGRWQMAATARKAAMKAWIAEQVRSVPTADAWQQTGPSTHGTKEKPLSWEQINKEHAERVNGLIGSYLEAAKKGFEECKTLAAKHKRDDAFSKSCAAWLSAN